MSSHDDVMLDQSVPVASNSSQDCSTSQNQEMSSNTQHQVASPHTTPLSTSTYNSLLPIQSSTQLERQDYSAYFAYDSITTIDCDHAHKDLSFCGYTALLSITESSEPTSYKAVVTCENWRNAMVEEFTALQKQGTWELVHPPLNRNVIGSKWVYKVKRDQFGKMSWYKARLVAQGFS
ncbi:hypothetical protein ACFX1W_013261 [Malus domestica]